MAVARDDRDRFSRHVVLDVRIRSYRELQFCGGKSGETCFEERRLVRKNERERKRWEGRRRKKRKKKRKKGRKDA